MNKQIDLFSLEDSDGFSQSVLSESKKPLSPPEITEFSFIRKGVFGKVLDGDRYRRVWITNCEDNANFQGRCSCSEYGRRGQCQHIHQLLLYNQIQYNIEKEGAPGQQFERSHWFTSGQNLFKKWGDLFPKVKLPHILSLQDASGANRIEIRGKKIGTLFERHFYGTLIMIDKEALRKMRYQHIPDSLSWETFYSQCMNLKELAKLSQQIQDEKLEFESSLLFAFLKHAFFYFKADPRKPPATLLENDELHVSFFS